MAFTSVPAESKNKINKAGSELVDAADAAKTNVSSAALGMAVDLVERWRSCHAYAINTFQSTLRGKLRNYAGSPVVAQRLKRMPTIVDKLKRHPNMQLSTMQDTGGVRAIVNSTKDVYKLAEDYENNIRLAHELVVKNDYIANPRSEDGYRSLHLIYKYKNIKVPEYDGLRLEVQIRSKLQHLWATAVESMGTFLGQALKSRQGSQKWLDFFALISAKFALQEGTNLPPRFAKLTEKTIVDRITVIEKDLNAIHKMQNLSLATDAISKSKLKGKGSYYHLIILDSQNRSVQVFGYERKGFSFAVDHYSQVEARAASGESIEPVLVSAGSLRNLRRAYPNFFLDIEEFAKKLKSICNK